MVGHNKQLDKKSKSGRLEERVNQKASLNIDVIKFLRMAGKNHQYNPLFPRLWHSITGSYRYNHGEIKTLEDFKDVIEKSGIGCFSGLGYKSFALFNQILKEYEIEPFKIGGRVYLEPARVKEMREYGLEPAHDRLYYLDQAK